MSAMDIIGVDPGKSGGLAILRTDGTVEAFGFQTSDPLEVLKEYMRKRTVSTTRVYFEEVGGYTGSRQPGARMFEFGFATGDVHGICRGLGLPIYLVRPQKWQAGIKGVGVARKSAKVAAIGAGLEDEDARAKAKSAGKKELCAEARRRFPNVKVTQQNADALLIADYGRSQQGVPS